MMSIYSGVCRIYTPRHSVHLRYPCISGYLPSFLKDVLGGRDWAWLETEIEWTERCPSRPRSSECRDEFGDRDRVNSEMHLEVGIEWGWRCIWRPRSSELRDASGGRDRVNSEIHLEAVIEVLGDTLGGHDRSRLEKYLEAVDREGGPAGAEETLSIGWFVIVRM